MFQFISCTLGLNENKHSRLNFGIGFWKKEFSLTPLMLNKYTEQDYAYI